VFMPVVHSGRSIEDSRLQFPGKGGLHPFH
jgi:hypothetical protein